MKNPIPEAWLTPAPMRRVVLHWTGGAHKASALDREHYHLMVEDDGRLVRGNYTIADNASTNDGRYAAHALNCNQGSIGISLCGMLDAVQSPYHGGEFEITRTQWATAAEAVAQLCARYGIPVTPQTVLQHGEIQRILGIAQKQKWDVCCLPWEPKRTSESVGDEFRSLVRAALAPPPPEPAESPERPPKVTVAHAGKTYPGVLQDSQTLVAVRPLADDGFVTIVSLGADSAKLSAGGKTADLPRYDLEGRGYVSVRKLAALLGTQVDYDPTTRTVKF